MSKLTKSEIAKVVNRYIGVNSGYLGDFSYQTHADFYLEYCDLDIDPYLYEGTTRQRFIEILSNQEPHNQAKILLGVIERFPVGEEPITRTQELKEKITTIAQRLEGNSSVPYPNLNSSSEEGAKTNEDIDKKLEELLSFTENCGGFGDPDAKEAHDGKIQALLELRKQEILKNNLESKSIQPSHNSSQREYQHTIEPYNMRGTDMSRKSFEIGIITIIEKELEALQDALNCDNTNDRFSDKGSLFWKANIFSKISQSNLSVVIHCIGKPGNQETTAATSKIIERFNPNAIFLMGIAAGRREKLKIGDVVIPRNVIDDTLKVAKNGKLQPRIKSPSLPHVISQMMGAYRLDKYKWHNQFKKIFNQEIIAPSGKKREYKKYVATLPSVHDATIYSSDVLLKDPKVLEGAARSYHQQIYIGEMEAGGFITACEAQGNTTPWFIVRGVSDFGDQLKNDNFHKLASCSAASYLTCFLQSGFDFNLVSNQQKSSPTQMTYSQLPNPQFFEEEKNGIRTTYKFDPVTGTRSVENTELA